MNKQKTYRTSWWSRGIAMIYPVMFLGVVVYDIVSEGKAELSTILILGGIGLFMAVRAYMIFNTSVIINESGLEYIHWGRTKLNWSSMRYYRINGDFLEIYGQDRNKRILRLSSQLDQHDAIAARLQHFGVKDKEMEIIEEEREEIEKNQSLGHTAEARLESIKQSMYFARYMLLVVVLWGGSNLIWADDFVASPKLMLFGNLSLLVIYMLGVLLKKRQFRLRFNIAMYPPITIGMWGIVIFTVIPAFLVNVMPSPGFWTPWVLLALVIFGVFYRSLRDFLPEERRKTRVLHSVHLAAISLLLSCGLIIQSSSIYFETSEEHIVRVNDRWTTELDHNKYEYNLTVATSDSSWTKSHITVEREVYDKIEIGDSIAIDVNEGLTGIRFYVCRTL